MSETLVQKLIDLVTFDQGIIAHERKRVHLHKELVHEQQEQEIHQQGLKKAHELLQLKRKVVQEKELEMKTLDAHIKEKKKRVDSASNNREYQSSLKELDTLNAEQQKLEQDLLDAWKQTEQAETEVKQRDQQCTQFIEKSHVRITDYMKEIAALDEQLQQMRTTRAEKTKDIAPELLEKYNLMYDQISNPVVPIQNGSCTACFYAVTKHDLTDLRRRKLVQCKDCFRFLYDPES